MPQEKSASHVKVVTKDEHLELVNGTRNNLFCQFLE
jgi:hypothetical protein